jgi:hypothetical protein
MSLSSLRAIFRRGTLGLSVGFLVLPALGQSLPPAQGTPEDSPKPVVPDPLVAVSDFAATPGTAADLAAAAPLPPPDPSATVGANGTPPTTATPQPASIPGLVINGGGLPVQLGLTLGGYYDDNIYIQPDGPQRVGDFIWTVAPYAGWNSAAQTGVDNSVQAAYSPTFIFYQTHANNDAVDQAGNFVYAYNGGKTDLVLSEVIADAQETAIDYGNLVMETNSVTKLNVHEQLTGKLSGNFLAVQTIVDDDPGLHSAEWTAAGYLDYQLTGKTGVGLGVLGGFADLEGPNQTYQQLNARITFDPGAKLSFNLTAGAELRETQGSGGAALTPVFSLGLSYQPFDGTNVGFEGYRRYDYSGGFYGEDYLATGGSVALSQRFLQKFYVTVSAAVEDAQYRDNFSNAFSNQSYDFFSVRAAVAFRPTVWCELSIFYQYRDNMAEGGADPFTDDQAGFLARFTY